MAEFNFKEAYTVDDLIQIMQLLRGENGCPWDREQTHASIKKNLIEETYEVIEAINRSDAALLEEELGDVLLQVVFHAQMEAEAGRFGFDQVADGICKKLIIRHPHIFGDVTVSNAQEVLSNWDDIKKATKGQKSQTDAMQSVPRELPALMRGAKVQQKAAKVGFDWEDASGALAKLGEEIDELKEALAAGDAGHTAEEMGDVLFSAVNVSRLLGMDAEEVLTASTDKFISRFQLVEQLAADRGVQMKEATLSQLDALWDEAKNIKKSGSLSANG